MVQNWTQKKKKWCKNGHKNGSILDANWDATLDVKWCNKSFKTWCKNKCKSRQKNGSKVNVTIDTKWDAKVDATHGST